MKNESATIARRLAAQMWGPVQRQKKVGPGIWTYTTAGHGGYVVDTDIRPQFKGDETIVFIRDGSNYYHPNEQHFAAYEEDCEAAKVEWLCPDIFRRLITLYEPNCPYEEWVRHRFELLRRSLEQWNSEWLQQHPEHPPFEWGRRHDA